MAALPLVPLQWFTTQKTGRFSSMVRISPQTTDHKERRFFAIGLVAPHLTICDVSERTKPVETV
jgi:hypothetical protein